MPAVSFKTLWYIFRESERGKTFNRYVIVVVEINQFAELQMSGKRRGFRRHTFHQIAVRHDCIGVMIDQRKIFLIESGSEVRRAHRHSHPVGKTLTQWPRRNLNSRRQAIFRMPWGLRSPLTKVLDLIQRKIVASQIQQRVKQHAAMTSRKQKAI